MPSSPSDKAQLCFGTVRAAGMTGFSALVAERGGNPGRLIASCGLDQRVLEEPDNIIPLSLGARLLHLAAKETNCPHFGLLLGQRQDMALLGTVGFLMRHSPDVRTALQDLIRYIHLQIQCASARLTTDGALAQFSYHIHTRGMLGAEHVYSLCMANQFNFIRLLCGKDWTPSAVHFCYPRPTDDAPFVVFFRVPVHFNQQSSSLFFSAQYLDRPTTSADPGLHKILQEYITQIESKYSEDFCTQLRGVLRMLLPTGKCSVDRVSELFSMHRRTLHRHLMTHHTTFEGLLDSMRYEIGSEMIREAGLPICHMANMLGYRSVSAFNRAFHRWYGIAPSEWRGKNLRMTAMSTLGTIERAEQARRQEVL